VPTVPRLLLAVTDGAPAGWPRLPLALLTVPRLSLLLYMAFFISENSNT